jgi:hypothetical protein
MGYCSGYCWYLRKENYFSLETNNNPSNNPAKCVDSHVLSKPYGHLSAELAFCCAEGKL